MEFKRTIYSELMKWKERHTGRVLELKGARQVGKTYILQKFARENYSHMTYFNMAEVTGKRFLECLALAEEWKPGMPQPEHELQKAMILYDVDFKDTRDTIIVIDEIQESSQVFNKTRMFARTLACDVIITGSYLGKILDKEFFLPAGDLDILEMGTLSFEEFLDASGKLDLFEQLDLYGNSPHEGYDEIKECFSIYERIGGYPAVVRTYFETHDFEECDKILRSLLEVFTRESKRYFKEIIDVNIFEKLFDAIGRLMIKEKTGVRDLVEEISKIAYQSESGRITKKMVNHAIGWLEESHILGYAAKSIDCNYLDIKENCRLYFLDLGIAYTFLKQVGASEKELQGILAENFAYLILKRHVHVDIAGNNPWFAIWQKTKGELDFFVRGQDGKSYGIEVKITDESAKTARAKFDAKKLDYLYCLKGDSYGGIAENGRWLTVPLYLTPRIRFDLS